MRGIVAGLVWGLIWLAAVVFTVGVGLIPFALVVFLTFAGAEKRQDRAFANLGSTLMREERLVAQAIQNRIFALWQRRSVVAITTSRVIFLSRGRFGGFTMQDIQWKDLTDARLEQNVLPSVCGSNLTFKHSNAGVGLLQIDGIAADTAAEIYTYAQEEEQAWEEKRRVRGMEETRAASGGVYVNTAPLGQASHATEQSLLARAPSRNRVLEEIERAKRLLDSGTISDSEFQEMKSKIIAAA